jgi:tRNA dimethylallyltransferase
VQKPLLIVIGGPTGSGKTDLSIRLAQELSCSIISADSRQVFSELAIGSAAPEPEQLALVKHYLVGSKSITEPFNAGLFELESLNLLAQLFTENPIQIVCGGTGLYIDALLNGLDQFPEIDPLIRDELNKQFQDEGLESLQAELKIKDPIYFEQIDKQNPQRLIRALEIIRSTGQLYSSLRKNNKTERAFDSIYLATDLPRNELYSNIENRTESMLAKGWLKETELLLPYRHLNSLQTVGYKELFRFLDDELSLDESIHLIKQNTRRYAKRQVTWLRNKALVNWVHPQTDAQEIIRGLLSK